MLTVYEKPVGGGWYFRAPNAVIKQLYYEYFAETLRQRTKLKEGMYEEISRAVVSMAADNDLRPFLQLVEKVIGRRKQDAARLEEKAAEARVQLQEYLQTNDLQQVPKLTAYAIVFVGNEARAVERVGWP